jgi:hypothetical protein
MNEKSFLIGTWKSDPNDETTQRSFGNVTLEIRKNGELIYTIEEDNKLQIMNLIYEIRGNILISDQPSKPQKEETTFRLSSDNKRLELVQNGVTSRYIKVE